MVHTHSQPRQAYVRLERSQLYDNLTLPEETLPLTALGRWSA